MVKENFSKTMRDRIDAACNNDGEAKLATLRRDFEALGDKINADKASASALERSGSLEEAYALREESAADQRKHSFMADALTRVQEAPRFTEAQAVPMRDAVTAHYTQLLLEKYHALDATYKECARIVSDIRATIDEEDDLLSYIVSRGRLRESGYGFSANRRPIAPLEEVFDSEGDSTGVATAIRYALEDFE